MKLRWLILLFVVLILVGCSQPEAGLEAERVRTRPPTETPGCICVTVTPPNTTRTPTATATDEPGPTDTPTATPSPVENLLINGDFAQRSEGWGVVNDFWIFNRKASNPSEDRRAAKMGQDRGRDGPTGWMVGDEDWLWQVVETDFPHHSIIFQITEIQHDYGAAQVRIFGLAEDDSWELLWYRAEPDAPRATTVNDWYTFSYEVEGNRPAYMLEFYGMLSDPNDGWKFTNLSLIVIE